MYWLKVVTVNMHILTLFQMERDIIIILEISSDEIPGVLDKQANRIWA